MYDTRIVDARQAYQVRQRRRHAAVESQQRRQVPERRHAAARLIARATNTAALLLETQVPNTLPSQGTRLRLPGWCCQYSESTSGRTTSCTTTLEC